MIERRNSLRSLPTFPMAKLDSEREREESQLAKRHPEIDSQVDDFIEKLREENPGWGMKMSDIDGNTFLAVGALFKILSIKEDGWKGCNTRGTSNVLSLYNMVHGFYNLDKFDSPATLISDDFRSLPDSAFLKLPRDYTWAEKKVKEELIGKTLRVVARSPEGSNRYGGCYYLFVVED